MGMILGFFLIAYIAIAVGIYLFIKHYVGMKWVNRITLVILILIPIYDIIITNVLAGYYCFTTPSTYINKKVEYPESIYFEDNIFGGFDKEDRRLMIMNYLDGIHLKTMALNGENEEVYVYKINAQAISYQLLQTRYTKEHEKLLSQIDYQNKSQEENENLIAKNKQALQKIDRTINNYIDSILSTQEVYTKKTMPKMNYAVTFNEVILNSFSRKFLYSDETKIIDNKTNKIIAYSSQYMPYFYNITLGDKWNRGEYYSRWAWETCVWHQSNTQYFFKDVFKKIHINSGAIAESFNSKLYRKYKKGE